MALPAAAAMRLRAASALSRRAFPAIRPRTLSADALAGPPAPKTGVLFLNMGGPSDPAETGAFLKRLFTDSDIIDLGGGVTQELLGRFVSWRRTPRIAKQYEQIGGSPIGRWSNIQAESTRKLLDEMHPASAPHKVYVGFRYAHPLTAEALDIIAADKVQRVVAFSQFPQWSCTTTGSSLNDLWREIKKRPALSSVQWSIIDRWPLHRTYIDAICERIEEKIAGDDRTTLLFSAHSVPMKVVEKGDTYTSEVAATTQAVMARLGERGKLVQVPKHVLAWQSKVGYLPWMVPSTAEAIKNLGKRGAKRILVVPVAFTSDHIETLFEIGIEYKHEAKEAGIEHFDYTQGLNGSETFARALAEIVTEHLEDRVNYSPQYKQRCLTCDKPGCRGIVNAAY